MKLNEISEFDRYKQDFKRDEIGHELRDEEGNNFAIYINGKQWKVFKGKGQTAGDSAERRQHRQLQDWAKRKSAATGKDWEVSITAQPASESVKSDKPRNFVAKHDHNKGGAHADKKNDYERKPKHKKAAESNEVDEAIQVNDTIDDVKQKIKDMEIMKQEASLTGEREIGQAALGMLVVLQKKLDGMLAAAKTKSGPRKAFESAKPKKRKVKTKAKKK